METLQKAGHRVATSFGTSRQSYGQHRRTPFQGIGQGNGAGPATWALISALLLAIMSSQGFGLNFTSILSFTAIAMVGFAFVDDTDLIHSANHPDPIYHKRSPTINKVRAEAQQDLNLWEGLIRATGGALNVKKSFWYSVDFKLKKQIDVQIKKR